MPRSSLKEQAVDSEQFLVYLGTINRNNVYQKIQNKN